MVAHGYDDAEGDICFDAGLGARGGLRLGGKIAPSSGQPIEAEVEIVGLKRDAWQRFGSTQVPVGDCAAVRGGGVEVVLIANRTQATGLELFTNLGIDPAWKKIVVVKSTNHFMAAAAQSSQGAVHQGQRPIWPLDLAARSGRKAARPHLIASCWTIESRALHTLCGELRE